MEEPIVSREIHHIPGRLRVRSVVTRRFPGRAEALALRFSTLSGVHSTHISPRTGSLTVHYDPDRLDSEELHEIIGLETASSTPAKSKRSRGAGLTKAGAMFGKAAFDVFVAKALEHSVVSVLTALR